MTKEDIDKVLERFEQYSDMEYLEFLSEPEKARWLMHKEEDYFHIIIFPETNMVYQTGTEADTVGVELKTYEDLRVRFESFTGEKL